MKEMPGISQFVEGCRSFPTLCAAKFGSSSHKEQHPITAPIDRPILVLKASVKETKSAVLYKE